MCGGGFLGVGVSGLVSRFIYVIERLELCSRQFAQMFHTDCLNMCEEKIEWGVGEKERGLCGCVWFLVCSCQGGIV